MLLFRSLVAITPSRGHGTRVLGRPGAWSPPLSQFRFVLLYMTTWPFVYIPCKY